ncbi:Two component sensor protein [Vibrio crassostreae]|jgi:two-component system heavy metal sensor histidine kinase CusS|nr:Two component sensor protein [Vibrio crassostreae]CAK1699513.1 Two component sensor protein [Vibrio crassostreae]CAK1699665.1 Two component sensor protein [Vibrio crassostreae]CAK1699695.1 Two component sensor protein [Vibrio crassostreae]CAK1702650.1 Two component sensor protein [Vibrio crassostreae]
MWFFEGMKIPQDQTYTISSTQHFNHEQAIEWSEGALNIRAFAFQTGEYLVVIGMNINHHILFLDKLELILFWSLGLAFLISSVYSYWIVNSGLKPFIEVNQHIQQISPRENRHPY